MRGFATDLPSAETMSWSKAYGSHDPSERTERVAAVDAAGRHYTIPCPSADDFLEMLRQGAYDTNNWVDTTNGLVRMGALASAEIG